MFWRLAAALLVGALSSAGEGSLRDVLRDADVTPRPPVPTDLLDTPVANGAEMSTDREYVYAGWMLSAGRFDTLHVLAIDRKTGAWRHHAFKENWNSEPPLVAGSIIDVRVVPHFVTLEMHHNPSASTTWVLRRDLSRAGAFYGWIKEILPNELMVYEQSAIHFAPTHALRISIYDPRTAQSRSIYPIPGGTAVRRAFVAGVKARWDALGEDWFRDHNHHGDPELFDSASGHFVVDATAGGLAFEVAYDDFTGTADGRSAASEHTIVSCDGLTQTSTVRCGEALEATWAQALPGRNAQGRLREAAAHPHLVPWK